MCFCLSPPILFLFPFYLSCSVSLYLYFLIIFWLMWPTNYVFRPWTQYRSWEHPFNLIIFSCSEHYFFFQKEDFDSEDDKSPEEKYVEEMSKVIPQGTDKTPEVLDSALKGLSARLVLHCRYIRNSLSPKFSCIANGRGSWIGHIKNHYRGHTFTCIILEMVKQYNRGKWRWCVMSEYSVLVQHAIPFCCVHHSLFVVMWAISECVVVTFLRKKDWWGAKWYCYKNIASLVTAIHYFLCNNHFILCLPTFILPSDLLSGIFLDTLIRQCPFGFV
jgi:hypothetical protein